MNDQQFRSVYQPNAPVAAVGHASTNVGGSSMEFQRSLMDAAHEQGPDCAMSLGIEASNDNLPIPYLIPEEFKSLGLGDDDEATHETRMELANTCTGSDGSRDQWLATARHQILTEGQNWPTYESRNGGERLAVAEFGVQHNQTTPTDHGSETSGFGFGVQMLGDLGGHAVQEAFHKLSGTGEVGMGLQGNNVAGSSIQPYVSGGYQQNYDLAEGFEAYGGVRGKAALGAGMSWAESFAGFEAETDNGVVDPFFGAELRAGVSSAPEFADFNDTLNGPYFGGEFTMGAEFFDTVRVGYSHEYGGPHGDPQGVVSISGPNLLQNDLFMNK